MRGARPRLDRSGGEPRFVGRDLAEEDPHPGQYETQANQAQGGANPCQKGSLVGEVIGHFQVLRGHEQEAPRLPVCTSRGDNAKMAPIVPTRCRSAGWLYRLIMDHPTVNSHACFVSA